MPRSRPLLLALLLMLAAGFASPASAQPPRLVRVAFDGAFSMTQLLEGGFDVLEGAGKTWTDVLLWPGDEARLAALGARYRLVDADPGRTAAELARLDAARPQSRAQARALAAQRTGAAPAPGAGSLGGFWTLDEIKLELDDLVANDTRDAVADKIDTVGYSLHGRPIWGLQIGRRVVGPDTRPVVFFNSLTHAREPGGMQALFHFAEHMLLHDGTDAEIKALLDQRRIYLVPVVNPDGYRYNQRIYDSTGAFGLWRKNLRDNNSNGVTDASDGVDLNRNFGYRWGFNNVGSSASPGSGTYRGPSAFSEIETRVQRDLVVALDPVSGFSFHTYSDLLIHPWGWTPAATPDSARFYEWNDVMTEHNGFTAGPGPRILYEVNGEFNDWMYGDTLLKPKGYTWTPEVGGPEDGFWPPASRIVPLSQSMLHSCIEATAIAGAWVRAASSRFLEGTLNAGHTAHLVVRARHYGAQGTAGPSLSATLTSLSPEAEVLEGSVDYPSLAPFTDAEPTGAASFWIAAVDTITPGRMVRFRIDWNDANGFRGRDTIEVVVGTPTVAYVESFDALGAWSSTGGWGIVANDPRHPSRYLADSPSGLYNSGAAQALTLTTGIDLSAGTRAWLRFEDRWVFESDFDAAVLEASADGVTWFPLTGNGSTPNDPASALNMEGQPVFEGSRWLWAEDRAELRGLAGGAGATDVRLRLRMASDFGLQLDGLSLDSLRVLLYDPAAQPVPVAVGTGPAPARLTFAPPSPNPARALVRFAFALPEAGDVTLEVLDVQGRRVHQRTERVSAASSAFAWGWDLRDARGARVAPGLYLARLRTASDTAQRPLVVMP